MRLDDYKNDLNKISCTPEFRAKMIRQLSQAPDEEFADSVSHVEQARKISISRYVAIAASAAVLVGFGSLMAVNLKSGVTDPSNDNGKTPVSDIKNTGYEMNMALYSTVTNGYTEDGDPMDNEKTILFGDVSDKTFEDIAGLLNEVDYSSNGLNAEEQSEKEFQASRICINVNGGVEQFHIPGIDNTSAFSLSISDNGILRVEQGTKFALYESYIFSDVLDAQCQEFPKWDWDAIFSGTPELMKTFKESSEQFELVKKAYEDTEKIPVITSNDLNIGVYIDNIITIAYNNDYLNFQAPEFFYKAVEKAMYVDVQSVEVDSNDLADKMAQRWADCSTIEYHCDENIVRGLVDNADTSGLLKFVRETKWEETPVFDLQADPAYMQFDTFEIYGFFFKNGYLYDSVERRMYHMTDGEIGFPEKLLRAIVKNYPKADLCYLIYSSKYRYDSLDMDVYEWSGTRRFSKNGMEDSAVYYGGGSGHISVTNEDYFGTVRTSQEFELNKIYEDTNSGYRMKYTNDHECYYELSETEYGTEVKNGRGMLQTKFDSKYFSEITEDSVTLKTTSNDEGDFDSSECRFDYKSLSYYLADLINNFGSDVPKINENGTFTIEGSCKNFYWGEDRVVRYYADIDENGTVLEVHVNVEHSEDEVLGSKLENAVNFKANVDSVVYNGV